MREIIINIIAEAAYKSSDEIDDTDTMADLGLDVLSLREIVEEIEDEFDIDFDDDEIDYDNADSLTVDGLIEIAERKARE